MNVAIGSDHAGYALKEVLKLRLEEWGHAVLDLGTAGTESVDYPDYAHQVASAVAAGRAERGVLVCGTGQGMAMSANRHAGVRAAVCRGTYEARLTREHNDANVLCLGARVVATALAEATMHAFFEQEFGGGRHARRLAKIEG